MAVTYLKGNEGNMNKNKVIIVVGILLIVTILILIGIATYDFYQGKQIEKDVDNILKQLDEQIEINTNVRTQDPITNTIDEENNINETNGTILINDYAIYGKIQISSVGIKYHIVEYNDKNLKNNICNLANMPINGTGNLCIAGHNTSNGTLFGKLKKVKCGDIVEVTNVYGQKYKYIIYSITSVEPEDNSLMQTSEQPIITLLTCTNSAKQRLVVQGQLIGEQ